MDQKDYYKILGISENASDDEIKKAFRRLARKYHPDSNKKDPDAEKKFKEVSEAYQVLKDKKKREEYDTIRKYGGFRPGGGGFNAGGGQSFDFSEIFKNRGGSRTGGGFGGFGSIFDDLFRSGGQSKPSRRRGSDVHVEIEIPFRKAIKGGKHTIRLKATETCKACGGTGGKPGAPETTCPQCSGTGTIVTGQGGFSISQTCPTCMGRGKVYTQACPDCHGTGKDETIKTININIPKGIEDGGKIRLRGQGNPGENGGSSGDLIITVKIEKDAFYTRKGKDLEAQITIPLSKALSGTKIKLNTIDGQKVMLTIPPLTQPGTRFRIPGKGAQEGGDMIVEVAVSIPKDLTGEQIEKITEILEQEN